MPSVIQVQSPNLHRLPTLDKQGRVILVMFTQPRLEGDISK